MPKLKKWREAIDWLGRGKLLFDLAVAIGAGTLIRGILVTTARIPAIWISPIIWLSGALILGLLLKFSGRKKSNEQLSTAQAVTDGIADVTSDFNAPEILRKAYNSTLQQEAEANIRGAAKKYFNECREDTLVKLLAIGAITSIYDMSWVLMYKSQFLLLSALNKRILPITDVKSFYEQAAQQSPDYYAKYSFEKWLDFMVKRLLLIHHPSQMFEITNRGRDFLKYLIHQGWDAEKKKL